MQHYECKPESLLFVLARIEWDPGGDPTHDIVTDMLVDGGATNNFIALAEVERLGLTSRIQHHVRDVTQGNGTFRTIGTIVLNITVNNKHRYEDTIFRVVPRFSLPAVLGIGWLRTAHAILDFSKSPGDDGYLPGSELRLPEQPDTSAPRPIILSEKNKHVAIEMLNRTPKHRKTRHKKTETTQLYYCAETLETIEISDEACWYAVDLPALLREHPELQDEFETENNIAYAEDGHAKKVTESEPMSKLLNEYADIFIPLTEPPPDRGNFNFSVTRIDPNEPPAYSKPYPVSHKEKDILIKEVTKYRQYGWLIPSTSPYGAPCLFVRPEKGGDPRMVVDLRGLNAQTVPMRYPIPNIQELLRRLKGYKYMTLVDAAKAFWSIRMQPGQEHMTAMSTPIGLFESVSMRQGMKNAASFYMYFMDSVMRGNADALPRYPHDHPKHAAAEELIRTYSRRDGGTPIYTFEDLSSLVVVYLDDICIVSKTLEQHHEDVKKVFQRCRDFDIRLHKPETYAADKINFLGYTVTPDAINALESRMQAVADWPTPTSAKELSKYLGIANYYRQHVPRFSHYSSFLTPLTSKRTQWTWGDEQQAAFDYLRNRLIDSVELYIPDPARDFVIACDSSIYGIGGALYQVDDDNNLRVCAWYSRQTTPAERKLSQYELELSGIHACVCHWRAYIFGVHTTIYNDHKPLFTGKVMDRCDVHKHNGRIARQIERLQQYDITLRHAPATDNIMLVPDAFSRREDHVAAFKRDMTAWHRTIEKDFKHNSTVCLAMNMNAETPLIHELRNATATLNPDDMTNAGFARGEDNLWRTTTNRLVVPEDKTIQDKIIRAHHDEKGHRGVLATTRLIQKTYWWPNLRKTVSQYISQCQVCHRQKPWTHGRGPLLPLPIATAAWQSVEVDFVDGLPESDGMNRILVITDRHSKAIILAPCKPTLTSKEFADLFVKVAFTRIGVPREWISDNDTVFSAKEYKEILKALKIKEHFAAPYAKGSQGQVERTNQTTATLLRCVLAEYDEEHSQWPRLLPIVEYFYNATPTYSTGLAPFEMYQGYVPGRTLDDINITSDAESDLPTKIAQIREYVTQRLLHEQGVQARKDKRKRVDPEYKVGQWVYLSTKNIRLPPRFDNAHTKPRFIGPYPVEKIINRRTVALEFPDDDGSIKNVISIDRIRPCTDKVMPQLEIARDEDGVEHIVYEVERIIDYTTSGRGKKQVCDGVKVRFKGYGEEYDLWQTVADFATSAPLLLQEFVQRHRLKLSDKVARILRYAVDAQS